MEIIHTEKTYSNDCTSRGFKIDIRDNNTMRVTSRSRWQGSRTDEVWIVQTPSSIIKAIKNEGELGAENEEHLAVHHEAVGDGDLPVKGRPDDVAAEEVLHFFERGGQHAEVTLELFAEARTRRIAVGEATDRPREGI